MSGIQVFARFRKMAFLLQQHIEAGLYKPGERLPSIKQLSETYNVTRTVARKALEKLRDEGIVRTRPGRGCYVAHRVATGAEKPETPRP